MFEKVNPSHVDKIMDRIAGAIVDLAYQKEENPKIAVEGMIGHGHCVIIIESSLRLNNDDIFEAVYRITGTREILIDVIQTRQDSHLSDNQKDGFRCGDNGIFKGMPVTEEQKTLTSLAKAIYERYPFDGKYIMDKDRVIICQSNASKEDLLKFWTTAEVNPLGDWTGGPDVDTGATNRKLGSDMGDSVTGGGLCMSGDTELISDDYKWHRIDEYKAGQKVGQYNDGELEFVIPERYIQNAQDNLILFENDSKLSMCLTPFHEVLVKTSKGNLVKHPALLVADSLLSNRGCLGKVIHSFSYEPQVSASKFENEAEYRLQVAFCADGTLLPNNATWKGRIRVKRQYKKERLRELLKNREYRETQDNEYSIFWMQPPVMSKSLYECFYDEDFEILRDEIFKWDGDEERKLFRTTIKEDADFIQFILSCAGQATGIQISDRIGEIFKENYIRKSILYTVKVYASNTTELAKNKDSFIDVKCLETKEPSYCFTVPSHNLVVRHNDRIFITGNCGKDLSKADVSVNIYAWLKAQETGKPVELSCAIGDTTVDGRPYSEIVEIAREYIKSVGGFEKFAEWGLIR